MERRSSGALSDFAGPDLTGSIPGLSSCGRFDPRGRFHRAGPHRRTQRTRPRHRPRQQHLRGAPTTEIAISEAHARDRSAEVAVVLLVEVEARLERNAPDRGADGLAPDLKRIAGPTHVAHRTGAGKLPPACPAAAFEDP